MAPPFSKAMKSHTVTVFPNGLFNNNTNGLITSSFHCFIFFGKELHFIVIIRLVQVVKSSIQKHQNTEGSKLSEFSAIM